MGSLPQVEGVWLNPLLPSGVDKSSLSNSLQGRSSNRSPVESPPAQKKALFRVSSDGRLAPGRFIIGENDRSTATLDRILRPSGGQNTSRSNNSEGQSTFRQAEGKENRSILKGHSSKGTSVKELARSGSVRVKRKVEFEPSVKVFHFDKVAGQHVGSESQTLSTEPRDRREFIQRMTQNKLRVLEELSPATTSGVGVVFNMGRSIDLSDSETDFKHGLGSDISEPLTLGSSSNSQGLDQSGGFRLLPRRLPILQPSQQSHPAADGDAASTVEFNFFEDEAQRLRIKFTVPLGDGVAATDVLVKANMAGNKVRVVASRTMNGKSSSSTNGWDLTSKKEEFSERYILPMEVDPYLITARLDGAGNLYVEAPIMTAERKKELGAEKQTKAESAKQGFSL